MPPRLRTPNAPDIAAQSAAESRYTFRRTHAHRPSSQGNAFAECASGKIRSSRCSASSNAQSYALFSASVRIQKKPNRGARHKLDCRPESATNPLFLCECPRPAREANPSDSLDSRQPAPCNKRLTQHSPTPHSSHALKRVLPRTAVRRQPRATRPCFSAGLSQQFQQTFLRPRRALPSRPTRVSQQPPERTIQLPTRAKANDDLPKIRLRSASALQRTTGSSHRLDPSNCAVCKNPSCSGCVRRRSS